jgi:hypothetical protein
MNHSLFKIFSALVLGLLFMQSAVATPVTWTLNGVTFSDDTTASGSFTYDADLNIYTNVEITTTFNDWPDGAVPYTFEYEVHDSGVISDTQLYVQDLYTLQTDPVLITKSYALLIDFDQPLTNGGGEVALVGAIKDFQEYAEFSMTGGDQAAIVAGTVTAVPVPAAIWLFGSALAGLGWMRRKQIV